MNISKNKADLQIAKISSILLAAVTLIAFALALTAIPNSGSFCRDNCFEYPYLDSLSEYPGDYLWMLPACLFLLIFQVFMISLYRTADEERKIYTLIALGFSLFAVIILVADYFVQFFVVPVSLMHGETSGISLLTQYNPHGVFIVLEELGYLMMSLSFLFASFGLGRHRLTAPLRYVFLISFLLTLIALTLIIIIHGIQREDRFEVAVISINWLTLIIAGILGAVIYNKELNKRKRSEKSFLQ